MILMVIVCMIALRLEDGFNNHHRLEVLGPVGPRLLLDFTLLALRSCDPRNNALNSEKFKTNFAQKQCLIFFLSKTTIYEYMLSWKKK